MAQRNRFKRRELKSRKVLPHQISIIGKHPVRELVLRSHSGGDLVNPQLVYCAPRQPLADGWPKDSQTAIAMQALEMYGGEFARL